MNLKMLLKRTFEITGYTITKLTPAPAPDTIYDQDGLRTVHNHDFLNDADFIRAYKRGAQAVGQDYLCHWRLHIALWVAYAAAKHAGDFVECGVNRGFMSSAIMEFLNWNDCNRTFYLLDTFAGLDERFVSATEREAGALEKSRKLLDEGFYVSGVEDVKANFAQWHNVRIIEGAIPETLEQVETDQVAYLHIDMNCSPPEVAAMEFFWERLVPGALVLFDDYAYEDYDESKHGMDRFAASKEVKIAALPTGQGLLIKPAG